MPVVKRGNGGKDHFPSKETYNLSGFSVYGMANILAWMTNHFVLNSIPWCNWLSRAGHSEEEHKHVDIE